MNPDDQSNRPKGRGDGFRHPGPVYFEALADRAINARRPTRRPPRYLLAAAAAAVLLITALFVLRPAPAAPPAPPVAAAGEDILNEVPDAVIDDYLDQYAAEFETDEIVQMLNPADYE